VFIICIYLYIGLYCFVRCTAARLTRLSGLTLRSCCHFCAGRMYSLEHLKSAIQQFALMMLFYLINTIITSKNAFQITCVNHFQCSFIFSYCVFFNQHFYYQFSLPLNSLLITTFETPVNDSDLNPPLLNVIQFSGLSLSILDDL